MESWAIEAIANGIIDAKIDQLKEEIVIKSHMLMQLRNDEWKHIQSKISEWRERFETMQAILDH